VLSSDYCTGVEKSTFVVCNLLGFIVIQEVIRDLQFCISTPFIYKKMGWLVDLCKLSLLRKKDGSVHCFLDQIKLHTCRRTCNCFKDSDI